MNCRWYERLNALFTLLMAGMLSVAVCTGLKEARFLARAGHAQGVVVSVSTSYGGGLKGGRGVLKYRPTISFTDAAGKAWTFDSGRFGLEGGRVGETLPVVYEAANPARAQIESFWGNWDPTFTFGYVAVFAFLLRGLVRKAAPPPVALPATQSSSPVPEILP